MSETTSPPSLELEELEESARDALWIAEKRHRKACDRMDRVEVEYAESFSALQAAEAAVEEILARLRLAR